MSSLREEIAQRYDDMYRNAGGDPDLVPWDDGRANPMLVDWLNINYPQGATGEKAVVVGCGLGDDVAELAGRGFEAVGFDISPTAVQWAAERHPRLADKFQQADLLQLPSSMIGRFDLVVEIYTLQSLPPAAWKDAAEGVASLPAAGGVLFTVARGRNADEPQEDHPPYRFTAEQYSAFFLDNGLRTDSVQLITDREDPPVRRLISVFHRPKVS